MKLLISITAVIVLARAFPNQKLYNSQFVQKLSPEDQRRIDEWNEDSHESIWELSGQFEGDIVLVPGEVDNGLINTNDRWPNRTVPYVFETNGIFTEEQMAYISETLKDYEKLTCITVRPKIPTDKDWVVITGSSSGCFSSVGRIGFGGQQLNLSPSEANNKCFQRGTILHEFLHALGFYHQQSATERDEYVTIMWDNIEPNKKSNFNKYDDSTITSFNVSYDYDSVLHYNAYHFSKNGLKTIVTTDPKAEIGQRLGFSPKDILKLHRMYGCDPTYESFEADTNQL